MATGPGVIWEGRLLGGKAQDERWVIRKPPANYSGCPTAWSILHRAPSIPEAALFINFPPWEAWGRLGVYIHMCTYLHFNFTHHFVGE